MDKPLGVGVFVVRSHVLARFLWGGCLSSFWQAWRDIGAEAWVVEVLREGYVIPFVSPPPLPKTPIVFASYAPGSLRRVALDKEILALRQKQAIELASPGPAYYSLLFLVLKEGCSWRPSIDLKKLNLSVVKTKFRMETPQSVLRAIRQGDWMFSIDLKDAYLQIPIHPSSRKFLSFVVGSQTWQFKALPFGLTTAPQVFTRVMAPVAAFLHRQGIRILRYLDDWIVLSATLEEAYRAKDLLLHLCEVLGIIINLQTSCLTPSQLVTYLGVRIDSLSFRASLTPARATKFLSVLEEFLSSREHSAIFWQKLLGYMASNCHLVPGGRLRMRALQLDLKRAWDFDDQEFIIRWSSKVLPDLIWWRDQAPLFEGLSLSTVVPDVLVWTDASNRGWGATASGLLFRGTWSADETILSINARELLAVERGLRALLPHLQARVVALFCDNTTAIAYLGTQEGLFPWFSIILLRGFFVSWRTHKSP